jgi:hypothetical protein
MWARISFGLMPAILLMASCSSDKSTGEGDKACQDLQAKLIECKLVEQGVCNTAEPCAVECAAHADCDQLKAGTPSGGYLTCVAACSGAGPTDFICKDASGYVKQPGVCDGIRQCPDGSDEANCSDAGTGGMTDIDSGSGSSASPECQAFVAHELSLCASYSRDTELTSCAQGTALYGPEGCLAQWNAFVNCAANAPITSCTDGPTGCDTEMNGYFGCQSRFVQKSGCARLDLDGRCTHDKPYLFSCAGPLPSNCAALTTTGGAPEMCCSQFAPP